MSEVVTEVVCISGKYRLEGTLKSRPSGIPHPGVVLIAGSGKESTRDGMLPIANYMVELGFTTLCFDKRGTGQSEGHFESTGVWDLVDDVIACVEFLKKRDEVDEHNIVLLGCSEGSRLALAANAKLPVQGLVLLVPPLESFEETYARQLKISFHEVMNQWESSLSFEEFQDQQLGIIRGVLESETDTVQIEDHIVQAKWIREYSSHAIERDLAKATCPMLIISGEKDLICPPERAELITQKLNVHAEFHSIPDMTHALRKTDALVDPSNWSDVLKSQWGQPLAPELLEFLEQWLLRYFCSVC